MVIDSNSSNYGNVRKIKDKRPPTSSKTPEYISWGEMMDSNGSRSALGGSTRNGSSGQRFQPQPAAARRNRRKQRKQKAARANPQNKSKKTYKKRYPGRTQALIDEAEHDIELREVEEFIENARVLKSVQDEFPTIQCNEIRPTMNFNNLLKAAAVYPLYMLAKRALSPEVTVPHGNQDYGVYWLAWATIAHDLYTYARTGKLSQMATAHPHYRYIFNAITPKVTDTGYRYTWEDDADFFTLFNTPARFGPAATVNFMPYIGVDNLTGLQRISNTVPILTEQVVNEVGYNQVQRVFQFCLNPGGKLVKMSKVPQYQERMAPMAFCDVLQDTNAEFPLACTVQLETNLDLRFIDLAELGLAQMPAGQSIRTCPFKEGSISGTADFHLKLVRPLEIKDQIRVLLKEVPQTSINGAILSELVVADRLVRDNLELNVIDQDPDSIFNSITSGQLTTVAMLESAHRFIIGGTIASLNGCPSGSIPLYGDVRSFIPIDTYTSAVPSPVNETLGEFYIHEAEFNAATSQSGFKGKHYYVPFVSSRGESFSINPIASGTTNVFTDFVTYLYPQATTVNAHQFQVLANNIPNTVNVFNQQNAYFVGPSAAAAIDQGNTVMGSIQAGVALSAYTDVNLDNRTLMYFTMLLEPTPFAPYDQTFKADIVACSNRFMLSSQTMSYLPTIAPIYYGTPADAASGYLAWYQELFATIGSNTSMGKMVTRYFRMFAHQRASRGGWGPDEFFIQRAAQNRGGGFWGAVVNAVTGAIGVACKVGKGLAMMSGEKGEFGTRAVMHLADNPRKYGSEMAVSLQVAGKFSRMTHVGRRPRDGWGY